MTIATGEVKVWYIRAIYTVDMDPVKGGIINKKIDRLFPEA